VPEPVSTFAALKPAMELNSFDHVFKTFSMNETKKRDFQHPKGLSSKGK